MLTFYWSFENIQAITTNYCLPPLSLVVIHQKVFHWSFLLFRVFTEFNPRDSTQSLLRQKPRLHKLGIKVVTIKKVKFLIINSSLRMILLEQKIYSLRVPCFRIIAISFFKKKALLFSTNQFLLYLCNNLRHHPMKNFKTQSFASHNVERQLKLKYI